MRIAGYQPVSLLDFPGRVAAIVFTQGCPLRCGFCHNPELLAARGTEEIPAADVLERIGARRAFLDGVTVTGGEPTVQTDLPEFLAALKALGLETKLDTNGVNPRMVERVVRAGLVDFVAMDVKHVWARYPEAAGRGTPSIAGNVRETMRFLQGSGIEREFRTTVCPGIHGVDDLMNIASELVPGDRYALQAVRYGATLDPDLERGAPIDLDAVAKTIRAERPGVLLEVRA